MKLVRYALLGLSLALGACVVHDRDDRGRSGSSVPPSHAEDYRAPPPHSDQDRDHDRDHDHDYDQDRH